MRLILGDNRIKLKELPENSVDSIVTDPPYGLSFMGKKWDYDVPSVELWKEALRVLKPGGYLLSFAGTRTQHRMAVNIEDAGFEIRDMIAWVYGSGFPKSHNIGKAVDKVSERLNMFQPFAKHYESQRKLKDLTHNKICDIGKFYNNHNHGGASSNWSTGANVPTMEQYKILQPLLGLSNEFLPLIERLEKERELLSKAKVSNRPGFSGDRYGETGNVDYNYTKGNSPYEGWGTALKPALEPITVARKPLSENTIVENVLKWGTGGINIDESRVRSSENLSRDFTSGHGNIYGGGNGIPGIVTPGNINGRFPANLIHDGSEEVTELFPGNSTGCKPHHIKSNIDNYTGWGNITKKDEIVGFDDGDDKSASRFFYCAKASKTDRNEGLYGFEQKQYSHDGRHTEIENAYQRNKSTSPNHHPTVKPTDLMKYLVRMVTPPNGTVLDPFMGSGSTGKACKLLGFSFIGIELDEDYMSIAKARIENALKDGEIYISPEQKKITNKFFEF